MVKMDSSPLHFLFILSFFSSFFIRNVLGGDDDGPVTCGSAIKLTHIESGGTYQLASNGHQWGGGSGQQVVTLINDEAAHSTLWLVVEADKETEPCMAGTPIRCGQAIRLTHLQTQKNLHTHFVRSALSGQQEISGFGENGVGDDSDNWLVMCKDSTTKYWQRGKYIRFKHEATHKYLSSAKQYEFNERNCRNCPILHHLEAAGTGRVDTTSYFKADTGVFLSH